MRRANGNDDGPAPPTGDDDGDEPPAQLWPTETPEAAEFEAVRRSLERQLMRKRLSAQTSIATARPQARRASAASPARSVAPQLPRRRRAVPRQRSEFLARIAAPKPAARGRRKSSSGRQSSAAEATGRQQDQNFRNSTGRLPLQPARQQAQPIHPPAPSPALDLLAR